VPHVNFGDVPIAQESRCRGRRFTGLRNGGIRNTPVAIVRTHDELALGEM
jgi:hypothetical protein